MNTKLKPIFQRYFSLIALVIAGLSLNYSSMSHANDSMYGEQNGTIIFEKNDDISMEYERLYISPEKITVDYLFRNESNNDITVDITFPMPPEFFGESDHSTIQNYQLFVEGQPLEVTPLFTVKTTEGKDITQELISLGWDKKSLITYLDDITEGRAVKPPFPTGTQWDISTDMPQYDLIIQDNYTWQQTFKANSAVHITHRYDPSITSAISIFSGAELKELEFFNSEGELSKGKFCLDNGFFKSLEAKRKKKGGEFIWQILEYILTTGNNWKGPIKNFNLIIEKDSPEQLVSLCFDGDLKKTSPTRFEFHQVNFGPKNDLQILFVGG